MELKALLDSGEAVAACPEVLGGLPTPRDPSERQGERVVSCTGRDVTEEFRRGAEEALRIYRENGCTMAVLKSGSPSCGCGLIHNGKFDGGMNPDQCSSDLVCRQEETWLWNCRNICVCEIFRNDRSGGDTMRDPAYMDTGQRQIGVP